MGLQWVQEVLNHANTAIRWSTNTQQADLRTLNASQAIRDTFDQPGSFSMVETPLTRCHPITGALPMPVINAFWFWYVYPCTNEL